MQLDLFFYCNQTILVEIDGTVKDIRCSLDNYITLKIKANTKNPKTNTNVSFSFSTTVYNTSINRSTKTVSDQLNIIQETQLDNFLQSNSPCNN